MPRNGWLTIVFLVGFGLLLFGAVLLGGRVFFWHDVTVAYMPLRKLAQDAWVVLKGTGAQNYVVRNAAELIFEP